MRSTYRHSLLATRMPRRNFELRRLRYVPEWDVIEIVTTRTTGFLIPRQWIGALQESSAKDLKKLAIWPDGSAIEIEQPDIHISVHGLKAHASSTRK
jgi:hypothetical protein